MRRLVAAALAATLLVTGIANGHAQEATPALTGYTLENGLEVLLVPDSKVPKVAVTLSYRVGVLNEPAGRSGFAHLFEHLSMLAGTAAYPSVDATFTSLGVDYNAYTSEDATVYYAEGLASTMPVILSVFADRMANVGTAIDTSMLDLQRSVVLNEMRQNVLDAPGAAAYQALTTGLFARTHPYSRSVSGSIPDLEAAALDDVKAFFNAYYVPNRAVLAIVGDFALEDAREMIEDTFGRIARGPEALPLPVFELAPTRARIELEDAVPAPMIYLGFAGPDLLSEENAALTVAGDLISNEGGPLRRELVRTGIASQAGAFWMPGRLGGRFVVFALGAPGVSAPDLEAALRQTLAGIAADTVDPADVERSRSGILLSARAALEAYGTRSGYLSRQTAVTGDATELLEDDPDFVALTADKVDAAIRKLFVLEDASVAVVLPGPRGGYPPVLSEASGTPAPLVAPERAPVDIPRLAAGEAGTVAPPPREVATLSNGIEIVHYQMPGAPLSYLTAIVTGGQNNDPPGREGLHDLATGIAGRGAGERDFEALGRAARDIGGSIGPWAGALQSGAMLSVRPDKFAEGVELLADLVQEPRFEAAEWAILVNQAQAALAQRAADPSGAAQAALNRVLYAPGPEDSRINATAASVAAVTLEDAAAAYRRLFVPATMRIFSVGALPLGEIVPILDAQFGTWRAEGQGVPSKPGLPTVFPETRRVYLRPLDGATQASIIVVRPAPGLDDPSFAAAYVVGNLVGGDFGSRLNTVIREQLGYSYGITAGLLQDVRRDGGMLVLAPVQADAVGPALAEMFKGFEGLATQPVTAAEMARTVTAQQTALAGLPETAESLFGALIGAEGDGISLAETLASLDRVAELDLADVQAEAEALAGLERAIVVIVGAPDLIKPQLEAMGITDVEIVAAE